MSHIRKTLLAALITVSACASNQPPERTLPYSFFEPTGTYTMTITDDGEEVDATMEITGEPGAYGGTISATTRPTVDISTVTATANQMTVTAVIANGVLVIRLVVEGDNVTGDWALRGDGGVATGMKTGPPQG